MKKEKLIAPGMNLGDANIFSKNRLHEKELALYLSHIQTLRAFMRTNQSYLIVFEDDITLNKGFNFNAQNLLNLERKVSDGSYGFDAINLGRCFDGCEGIPGTTVYSTDKMIVKETCAAWCAHATMYTREGARTLLEVAFPIRVKWDGLRLSLQQSNLFKMYSTIPALFVQDRNQDETNVHTEDLVECFNDKFACFGGWR
mmetsp:Transcript_23550/g.35242  ORF Transcript_23550/g.35242 Transcript_23550/m.35242 type:complete len:200 (+) Transcript_23550:202-801(+)